MAPKSWMPMATGSTMSPTDMCGRREWRRAGLRIVWVAGVGWITTAGVGSATIPGDGLPITMDAGTPVHAAGCGIRARSVRATTGVLRWSDSSAGVAAVTAADLDSAISGGALWR